MFSGDERLCKSLDELKRNLVTDHDICKSLNSESLQDGDKNLSKEEVLRRLEVTVLKVVTDIAEHRAPTLAYSRTTEWSDVSFRMDAGLQMKTDQRKTTVKFESLHSMKKFSLMMKVLSLMHRLIRTGTYCTKRDIYYQDPELFGNQSQLDNVVDNISCMLSVPRWELHVLATSKGCVAGDLVFQDADNNYIDCRNTTMGIQVPAHVPAIHNIMTNAKFILVVEKDATFQKLLGDRICEKLHPSIIVTGKGFPDLNTRMLLRRLWEEFKIPVLALVDADPHGFEIMAVYKFGSRSLSYESGSLTVPSLKWLGVLPTDISRLGIPEEALIKLSKSDCDKGQELLGRPYMKHFPLWRHEVEEILSSGKKAEIQALDAISPDFLCDVYLPNKIRCAGWL